MLNILKYMDIDSIDRLDNDDVSSFIKEDYPMCHKFLVNAFSSDK